MGRQSDSNVERTLGHVEPTMGGVMTSCERVGLGACGAVLALSGVAVKGVSGETGEGGTAGGRIEDDGS